MWLVFLSNLQSWCWPWPKLARPWTFSGQSFAGVTTNWSSSLEISTLLGWSTGEIFPPCDSIRDLFNIPDRWVGHFTFERVKTWPSQKRSPAELARHAFFQFFHLFTPWLNECAKAPCPTQNKTVQQQQKNNVVPKSTPQFSSFQPF